MRKYLMSKKVFMLICTHFDSFAIHISYKRLPSKILFPIIYSIFVLNSLQTQESVELVFMSQLL